MVEYRSSKTRPPRAIRSSASTVLAIPHPFTDHHNGGQLQFGPDGHLWISTGDGESGRDAIYAWGLRNPWRFSFDRVTGALAVAGAAPRR